MFKVWLKLTKRFWRRFFSISSMYFWYFVVISKQTRNPVTQGCFVRIVVDIGPVVREKKIFLISSMYFRYFLFISLSKKGVALHSNRFEFPSSKYALCHDWLKLTQQFWRKWFFFNFVNIFSLVPINFPWKKGVGLHLNRVDFPSPK